MFEYYKGVKEGIYVGYDNILHALLYITLLLGMARVALICAFAASAHAAIELTPENFDKEVVSSGKSAFIKFLAPW